MAPSLTRRRLARAGAALLLAGRAARAAEPGEPITMAQIVELSGTGAAFGDAWRSGVEFSVQEINAAGGRFGKLVQVVTFDAQSSAAGGRAAMQKALELDPVAVLGPALSEPSRGALSVPRARGTPLILGGAAAELTGPAHPATWRAVPSAGAMMARLCAWLRDAARTGRLALYWSAREPFRTGRDALLREARAHGLDFSAEWVAESGDVAADLPRLLKAAPDVLVVLVAGDLAPRVLAEARRQAPRLAVVGDATLVDPRVLRAAGAAAEGVRAHVLLPPEPDAGLPAWFAARYRAANGQPPDQLAVAGYLAVAMLAAALNKAGAADARALADALQGLSATAARQPMLLADCAWNDAGDPDRPSWIVEARGGTPRAVRMLRD
jgi:branched-chain amino acid transport system substrate-binding protein